MKIAYGINGSGLGHATRSLALIEHLTALNHDIILFSHGKAFSFLQEQLPDLPIHLTPSYAHPQNNTLRGYCKGALTMHSPLNRHKQQALIKTVRSCQPDIVITDDEPSLPIVAHKISAPCISLSFHNYLLDHNKPLPLPHQIRLQLLKTLALLQCPNVDLRINASPFLCKGKSRQLANVAPILPSLLTQKKWQPQGTHIVAYFNQALPMDYHALVAYAKSKRLSLSFYGNTPGQYVSHLMSKATSHHEFLNDLLTADALICTPGSQLACEAAHIGLPTVLVTPPRQLSQELTARLFAGEFKNMVQIKAKNVTYQQLKSMLDQTSATQPNLIDGVAQTANLIIQTADSFSIEVPNNLANKLADDYQG